MGGYVWYVFIWNCAELQLVVEKGQCKCSFNDPRAESVSHTRLNFVDILTSSRCCILWGGIPQIPFRLHHILIENI